MNIEQTGYKHSTVFGHHSEYFYGIDPSKFTDKWVYPNMTEDIQLNDWDLANHAIEKAFYFYEVDKSGTVTRTIKDSFSQTNSVSTTSSTETTMDNTKFTNSTTTGTSVTNSHEYTLSVSLTQGEDILGNVKFSYLDPILIKKQPSGKYKLKYMSSGAVTLCIAPKSDTFTKGGGTIKQ